MFEVPLLWADGRRHFWHTDDAKARRVIANQNAIRLSRDEWLERFYHNAFNDPAVIEAEAAPRA